MGQREHILHSRTFRCKAKKLMLFASEIGVKSSVCLKIKTFSDCFRKSYFSNTLTVIINAVCYWL